VRTSLLGTNCHLPDTGRDNQNLSGFVAVIPVDILGALRLVSWLRRLLVTAPQESLVMVIGRYMYDGYLEGWMEHRHPYAFGIMPTRGHGLVMEYPVFSSLIITEYKNSADPHSIKFLSHG
jgi:hypothetical protein